MSTVTHMLFRFFTTNSCNISKILGLITIGLLSRLIPHPPNFTALNAIALLGLSSSGSLGMSLFTILSTLLFSDLVFGFHSSLGFVYLSFGLTVLMGNWLKKKKSLNQAVQLLLASSILFFILSNFGTWLQSPCYPKTIEGLSLCYLAAIPFFVNEVIGTLSYGLLLYGWFTLAETSLSVVPKNNM